MATTFIKIASVTVGTATPTIDFTSIPASYTDLCLILCIRSARPSSDSDDMLISFNSSTSNFTGRFIYGNGTSTVSSTGVARYAGTVPASTSTATVFGNGQIYIPNYTSANNKSFSVESVSENNSATAYGALSAGLWSNTAAITSISFTLGVGPNFAQYSTAILYGIKSS